MKTVLEAAFWCLCVVWIATYIVLIALLATEIIFGVDFDQRLDKLNSLGNELGVTAVVLGVAFLVRVSSESKFKYFVSRELRKTSHRQ